MQETRRRARTNPDDPFLALRLESVRFSIPRSMAFTEGRVYDAEGQLCAVATGTFKYVVRRESANPSTD